jgi:hypothetical protein
VFSVVRIFHVKNKLNRGRDARATSGRALAVLRDADLAAHVEQGADGAFGGDGGADVFAEGDAVAIDAEPVFFGEFGVEGFGGLRGGIGGDVTPAVGDLVDVGIDGDARRFAAGDADGEAGAFGTDAAESEEGLVVAGELTVKFFDGALGDGVDVAGFGFGERAQTNCGEDLIRAKSCDVGGGGGEFEQCSRGGVTCLFESADGEDAGDEDFEDAAVAVVLELEEHGFGEGFGGAGEAGHHDVDVKGALPCAGGDGSVHGFTISRLCRCADGESGFVARATSPCFCF